MSVSPLFKVLTPITDPTAGRVEFWNRVLSLLEVGTPLHPVLTGRENLQQNSPILGTSRREIIHQLDATVDFAAVARLLDAAANIREGS